jgi:hypothetical protein
MESTESRRYAGRRPLDGPRASLSRGHVRGRLHVVLDEAAEHTLQSRFVHGDDVIEAFTSERPDAVVERLCADDTEFRR